MARIRMSDAGDLRIPPEIRRSLGLADGGVVDVSEQEGRLIVAPVSSADRDAEPQHLLTIKEFLARRLIYQGPPITEEMIEEAVLEEAEARWNRVQALRDGEADDDTVD